MRFWVKWKLVCTMRNVSGSHDENNSLFWKKKKKISLMPLKTR